MSRIRSIHQKFAKDKKFVRISRDARLFFLLLLTECDDQGVFDWDPFELKMELFPVDNISIDELLAELASIDAVKAFEVEGRHLGAVRNFRKFQKPKSPNAVFPLPSNFRSYVGLEASTSEIDEAERGSNSEITKPQPTPISPIAGDKLTLFPPKAEKPFQMEEEEESSRKRTPAEKPKSPPRYGAGPQPPSDVKVYAFEGRIIRLTQKDFDTWKASFSAIHDLAAELQTIDDKLHSDPPPKFDEKKWFGLVSAWLRTSHNRLVEQGNGAQKPDDDPNRYDGEAGQWRIRIERWLKPDRFWVDMWGAPPGRRGCQVLESVLQEFATQITLANSEALGAAP